MATQPIRLNDRLRQAFVEAVMADTPTVDYQEQVIKTIKGYLISITPNEVLKIYNSKNRMYLKEKQYITFDDNPWGAFQLPLVPQEETSYWNAYRITDVQTVIKLKDLAIAYRQQDETLSELRNKLRSAIWQFNTVRQARDAMPEFAKYLPEETEKSSRQVPAIANLVADLIKAGWPKDKAEAKAKEQVNDKAQVTQ